jgi:ABC-2 type transport system ATP-binding protein
VEIDPLDQRLTAFPRPGVQIFGPVGEMLRAQGIAVSEIQLERGRLDEVFRNVTQAPAAGAAA